MSNATNNQQISFREFAQEIKGREGELAYGSETAMLGDLNSRMAELGGKDWRESDEIVPAGEVAWWRRAYELYAADLALPLDERATDLQDIYDRV